MNLEFGNELETHPIRFNEFFSSTYDVLMVVVDVSL